MTSINKQLNIGVIPPNTNIIPSRYARATRQYQVQLGTEDPSLDYYNDAQSLDDMSNANGWGDCKNIDLISEVEGDEEFSNFAYPACVKADCKTCKAECKSSKGLKWRKGGKDCYNVCRDRLRSEQMDRINEDIDAGNTDAVKGGRIVDENVEKAGMSTGAKVGLAVGGLAVLGLSLFLILRKK